MSRVDESRVAAGPLPRSARVFFVAVTAAAAVGAVVVLAAGAHATVHLAGAVAGLAVLAAALVVAAGNAVMTGWDGRRPRWHWPVIAAILVVTAVAYPTHVALTLRFAASESAFDRVGSTLPAASDATWANPEPVAVSAQIGLYRIRGADLVPGGVIFHDPDGGDLSDTGDAGFAYLPDGPDSVPTDQGYVLSHLAGSWYSYWQSS